MKPIEILTNTEKGRLLADLFPTEMTLFLDDLKAFCADFRENKKTYEENWTSEFVPFNYWQHLSSETENLLIRHIISMKKSSKVFSDQLFFSDTALFVNDRLIKYAEKGNENERFKLAVKLFYNIR